MTKMIAKRAMNEKSAKHTKHTAAKGVEVSFTLTAEQYRKVKAACDEYRIEVGELAADGLFSILLSHAGDTFNWMDESLKIITEARATGQHPRYESWIDELATSNKQTAG